MLISVKELSKHYGGIPVFSGLEFSLVAGRKVALIGKNGEGKTSLLNILTGIDSDFDGQLTRASTCRIGYLTQGVSLPPGHTLFEECLSHFSHVLNIKEKIKDIESRLSEEPEDEALQEKYGDLLHQLEDNDGYNIEHKVERVLTGLGFEKSDWDRPISTLSGGEHRRGLLGKILLGDSNLLFLDEPTNHLDIYSIRWLEDFLREYNGAVFMVSHDRHFLNSIVEEVYELEAGRLNRYVGNYERYVSERLIRYEADLKQYELQQEKIEKEEEFIRKNLAGQKTKQAKSRRTALEKMARIEKPRKPVGVKISLHKDLTSRKNILEIKKFSKSFGESPVLSDVSVKLMSGEKLGLIGRNGCGKSTLIKGILDHQQEATVDLKEEIRVSYFSQGAHGLDESLSLFDTIHDRNPKFERQTIRDYLALFQFRGDDVDKVVSQLSGGERTRLALLCSILEPSDLYILDEPTNHLDIVTREALGEALREFPGTIIAVSHDRSFLDMFCTRLLLISEGRGHLYEGNYSDNEDKLIQREKDPDPKAVSRAEPENTTAKKKNINVYKVSKLEAEIAVLEAEQEAIRNKMLDEAVYTNYEEYQKLDERLKELDGLLEGLYESWESLHE
ncbi:MAG: ABC-F family ATP-binding cassette domain-containing protein [Spirochaetota bacterium]|nr:ABC-F family ATP-binding cassette domain-containing protein [Spirochaetota bacterium]